MDNNSIRSFKRANIKNEPAQSPIFDESIQVELTVEGAKFSKSIIDSDLFNKLYEVPSAEISEDAPIIWRSKKQNTENTLEDETADYLKWVNSQKPSDIDHVEIYHLAPGVDLMINTNIEINIDDLIQLLKSKL